MKAVSRRLVLSILSFSKVTLEEILRIVGSEQRRTGGRRSLLLWTGGEIMEYSRDAEYEMTWGDFRHS